jgi:hypothetical protein
MAKNYKNKEKTPPPAPASVAAKNQPSFKSNFYNLFPLVAWRPVFYGAFYQRLGRL